MADEQKRLQRAHRSWILQKQNQDSESPEAANSLPQSVFHLSASFPGGTHQLLASQAMVLNPFPGIACYSSNLSQLFPPNVPHKHPFPLQKALGKHMRESRETKSKQKNRALQSELEITDTLPLVFPGPTLSAECFHFSCKLSRAKTSFFYSALNAFFGK